MTDNQTDDSQREVQRLTAELARRERENTDLKEELARTKGVQDDFWSHDIYLEARKKMLGGVFAILGVLSAFGLVTVYQLYQNGLNYVGTEMKRKADSLIQAEIPKMIEDVKTKINKQVEKDIVAVIDDGKTKIDKLITKIYDEIYRERLSLTDQARQIRLAMTAPTEAQRLDSKIPEPSVDCDPNYLDDAQIARVGIRQLSEGTGRIVRDEWEVFKNTFFVDVRGAVGTASLAAEAKCILTGVDRIVYGADPKWYRPSEFVRFDRKNDFRFTISGWGPTELTAQVYFIGRRDPETIPGHLAIRTVTRANKIYLGDAPEEFQ